VCSSVWFSEGDACFYFATSILHVIACRITMPRSAASSGTNSQGNTYTTYSDGAYRYSNSGGGGGNYYNDGGRNGGNGFYSNSSTGYSSYTRSDGSGWSQSAGQGRTSK
jgi:hypothetical protein